MFTPVGKFRVTSKCSLVVARGSVLDYAPTKPSLAAIVNAANEGCLGGGGVDGAITTAGGANLAADRRALPVLESIPIESEENTAMMSDSDDDEGKGDDEPVQPRMYNIRCKTGFAVITGPGEYGSLPTSFVVHAVGPNYYYFDIDQYPVADNMLKSAYIQSLIVAESKDIQELGFSLLSAGVFRGHRTLKQVLELGIKSMMLYLKGKEKQQKDEDAANKNNKGGSLEEIVMCGFTERECAALLWICDKKLGLETLPLPESADEEKATEGVESADPSSQKRKRKSEEKDGKEELPESSAMDVDEEIDDAKCPASSVGDDKKASQKDPPTEESKEKPPPEAKTEGDASKKEE